MSRLPAGMAGTIGSTAVQVDAATGYPADTAVEKDPESGAWRVVWLLDNGLRRVAAGLESRDPRVAAAAAQLLRPSLWRAGSRLGE